MAAKAAYANRLRCAKAIQIHTMTEGTGSLNTLRRVMEGIVRAGPLWRVSIVFAMTAFAPLVACSFDADVEPRIAAGAAGLAMAGLADSQVRFGIRAMIVS